MSASAPAPVQAARETAFSPLRHRAFRTIWLASMASNFGFTIQAVGASWMMTSIAGSAEMVALVQASVTLPIMLFSLLAGAMADNFDRRRMMFASQIFMLVVSAVLAIATWLGLITPWLLLTFTFLIGCGVAFNGPAWQASVGEMVPRSDLPGAIALNSMGFNIARSVGPAIGGAIVAAAGAAAAFALNALSYFALIGALFRWRPEPPATTLPRERIHLAMAAGARYAAMSPSIGTVLLRAALFGIGASAVSALLPLVARDLIGGGPVVFGLLLGAFGLGAVGGALGSARLRRRFSSEAIVRIATLQFAGAALVAGWSQWLVVTAIGQMFAGAAWVLALSTFNVTVQMNSPRWVVARALSLYQMAAFGGMAVGAWLWGWVAEAWSLPVALAGGAAVLVAGALLGLKLPLPDPSEASLDPRDGWEPPDPAVRLTPTSGPVVVTVEFRIQTSDLVAFLAAMADRRRIRRRNGARHWQLLRDVGDPEKWIERFDLANWTEYIRHNQRLTESEAAIVGRARELHQGPEPPRVQRLLERQPIPPDMLARPLSDSAPLG